MEGFEHYKDFKLEGGDCENILNSQSTLIFGTNIPVANDRSIICNGHQVSTCASQSLLNSEPSISVVKEDINEEEFVSHNIVEKKNHLQTKRKRDTSKDSTYNNGLRIKKGKHTLKPSCKVQRDAKVPIGGLTESSNYMLKLKRRKDLKLQHNHKLGQNSKKTNDVVSIVLKNMANHKNNYAGMKMMIQPQTGEYILRSSYVKPSSKETFNVEPWMLHRPRILQQSKEKLFILNNKKHDQTKVQSISSTIEDKDSETNSNLQYKESIDVDIDIPVACGFESVSSSSCSKVFIKQNSESVKSEKTEQNSDNSHTGIVYWEEGNIDKLTSDYVSVSETLKKSLPNLNEGYKQEFPEYLCLEPYESTIATKSGAAPGIHILLSWNAVKKRIEEIMEETMTKFIFEYRSPVFLGDPQPFQPIYFELDKIRKNIPVIIPKTGIPFIFFGICVFGCHLGRKKWKSKEEGVSKQIISKKIGCPATLSVVRVARFPDFEIPIDLLSPKREKEVLKELRDAWDYNHQNVRYYIEYHVNEPNPSDHKGHEVQYLVNSNRFKEPVDPRILDKIRDLIRAGVTAFKSIQEKVQEFVREELFKGVSNPPLERRRYNPSQRDIRYAIVKAKDELKKEGKSLVQLQCTALANDISQMVKDITHEEYLSQIKSYLSTLYKTVKAKEPLQISMPLGNTQTTPNVLKRTSRKKQAENLSTSPTAAIDASLLLEQQLAPEPLPEQVIEQFYISVPEANDTVFSSQLYSQDFVDINGGMVDALPTVPDDSTVTEVYYYYPDGTCEIAAAEPLDAVQA